MASAEEVSCSDGTIVRRMGCILTYGGTDHISDIVINYTTILLNLVYCTIFLIMTKATMTTTTTSSSLSFVLYDKESTRRGTQETNSQQQRQRIQHAIGSFVFVILFQIVLCLGVGCSGVSIIWCAIGGWLMSQRRRLVNQLPDTPTVAAAAAAAAATTNTPNTLGAIYATANTTTTTEYGPEPTAAAAAATSRITHIQTYDRLMYYAKVVICFDTLVILYYMVIAEAITTVAHICALVLGAVLSEMSLYIMDPESYNTTTSGSSRSFRYDNRRNATDMGLEGSQHLLSNNNNNT